MKTKVWIKIFAKNSVTVIISAALLLELSMTLEKMTRQLLGAVEALTEYLTSGDGPEIGKVYSHILVERPNYGEGYGDTAVAERLSCIGVSDFYLDYDNCNDFFVAVLGVLPEDTELNPDELIILAN